MRSWFHGARIGLALGGGAARGLAHIGALKAFEEEGIPVSAVAGTSAGSIVGAAFAAGLSWRAILDLARKADWRSFVSPTLPRMGLLRMDRLERFVEELLGGKDFRALRLPFTAVAVDVTTGEEVRLREGPVAPAVRASCSIPGLFEPASLGGRFLVDGGLAADVPVEAARQLGADRVIGVALNAGTAPFPTPANIMDVLSNTFQILARANALRNLEGADLVVAPRLSGFGYQDLSRLEELVALGESAARESLSAMRRRLLEGHWLRRGTGGGKKAP